MHAMRPDVLLIEDDPFIREALSEVLQDEGFAVETAVHGRAAADLLDAGARPRLILLDLMMPVMDGWQFMGLLRAHEDWAQIPVIVVSAAKEALPEGACSCLSKPLDLAKLFDTMGSYCVPHGGHEDAKSAPEGHHRCSFHA